MAKRQIVVTESGLVRYDDPVIDRCFPKERGVPSPRLLFRNIEDLSKEELLVALTRTVEERNALIERIDYSVRILKM